MVRFDMVGALQRAYRGVRGPAAATPRYIQGVRPVGREFLRAGAQRGIQVGQLLVHLGTVLDEGAADFMPLARAARGAAMGAGPTKSRGLNYICLRVRYNPPVSL
ncbi:hypothetical protein WJ968_23940 [Achromobacter xylosoxidans]